MINHLVTVGKKNCFLTGSNPQNKVQGGAALCHINIVYQYLCSDRVGVQVHSCDGSLLLGPAASTKPDPVAGRIAVGGARAQNEALGTQNPGNHKLPHKTQHFT